MFVKKDDITYRIGHFHEEELKEMIENFCLVKIQPSLIDSFEQDMIFIRGHVEIIPKDEDQPLSDKNSEHERISLPENNPFTASPFAFISKMDEVIIKIKETSLFLVGDLDYELFEKLSARLSKTGSKLSKKQSTL
jgi:hypothetical protein